MRDSRGRLQMRNQSKLANTIGPMYEAARAEAGGQAVMCHAADGLASRVQKHDNVVIATGAGSGPLIPKGENDGPIGAAVLAQCRAPGHRSNAHHCL
jgi:hypothetical protein